MTGAPIASYNLALIIPANYITYSYFNVTNVTITDADNNTNPVVDENNNALVVTCALNTSTYLLDLANGLYNVPLCSNATYYINKYYPMFNDTGSVFTYL